MYIYARWDSGFGGSGWLGPVGSGEVIEASHAWDEEDRFVMRARAKDTNGNISAWTSYEISTPKIKTVE